MTMSSDFVSFPPKIMSKIGILEHEYDNRVGVKITLGSRIMRAVSSNI